MSRLICSLALIASILTQGVSRADEAKEKSKKPAPATEAVSKKATHKVEKGPFKVEVSLKGILESAAMSEVLISPEAFTPENRGQLRVLKALDHGTLVHKGDQLVWLDMERIDQIITDLAKDRALADLSFKLAHEDLNALEKATPIDLAFAERSKKVADEDLKRFLTQDKDFLIKMTDYEFKSAANYLSYAKEELGQLEKMYKASDLTEGTEEIILKRQRDTVERAAFYFKMAEYDRDYVFKVSLPRREVAHKENNVKQTLLLEKTKANLPLLLNQKRLTLDKMTFERQRTIEKLEKFKKDRDTMVVKAPADGILYFGRCVRGHWSSSSMESRLQRGGNLMPDEVILTIVQPRPLFVRATVDEKDFGAVHAGLKGKVVPTPLPDVKLTAQVDKVAPIPLSAGSFEARIKLDSVKEPALMPGMACTVKLISYQKADALTVPASAVFTDEKDEDIHFVYVQGSDDKHTKVYVTPGKKSSTRIEILQGVREGDAVLLEKPAAAKTKS
jgi:hypothetical protein